MYCVSNPQKRCRHSLGDNCRNLIYEDETLVRIVISYEYICIPIPRIGFEKAIIELAFTSRVMGVIFLTDARSKETHF
jgi:hypothetical protein